MLKDAIVDTFRKKYNKRPNVEPKKSDIKIHLHINKHTCTISLDSSGDSLHKRGYKLDAVTAPMNEVLAAGLILLSKWNKSSNFHDPMCGSGTVVIEAALIAYNIPVNIFRQQFGFQNWEDFDEVLWKKLDSISRLLNIKPSSITALINDEKYVYCSALNIDLFIEIRFCLA